ncbi:MAG: multidrug efflux SMR transporter [Gammaproteobacteria bacterium]|nr:multidrug efflux SMR transporter [Gammaproteobacteria bacterium]
MNAWTYLFIGIVLEVAGTTSLKLSNGFTQPVPTILCMVFFLLALFMISLSVKTLGISIVYAIWSGLGIALITLIGVFYFHEALTFSKIFFIAIIVIGVIGLQAGSEPAAEQAAAKES